jgi:hypothetical protein
MQYANQYDVNKIEKVSTVTLPSTIRLGRTQPPKDSFTYKHVTNVDSKGF